MAWYGTLYAFLRDLLPLQELAGLWQPSAIDGQKLPSYTHTHKAFKAENSISVRTVLLRHITNSALVCTHAPR
jgi:hypothetical protein|eukprot:COSAG01_NODE_1549_length_9945_cov_568.576376_6_plen_73_part_00